MSIRSATIVVTTALLILMSGCKSQPKKPGVGEPEPVLRLLEELSPSGSVSASDFHLLDSPSRQYAVLDDEGQIGSEITVAKEETDRFGAEVALAEGNLRKEFLRFDEQGNIVMSAAIDSKERAISRFDPPLIAIPAQLNAGETVSSECTMRVLDLRNPAKVRENGVAKRTIKYAADQRIQTPRGEFKAKRIEAHFSADLNLAKAETKVTMFVVPEIGVIAEQTIEDITVLGAFGNKKERTLVLTSSTAP